MKYYSQPRDNPGLVNECCSCPVDKQIPVKGNVNFKLEQGTPVGILKFWCGYCGRFFTMKDQDKYFPSPNPWTETRPLYVEPVEDD